MFVPRPKARAFPPTPCIAPKMPSRPMNMLSSVASGGSCPLSKSSEFHRMRIPTTPRRHFSASLKAYFYNCHRLSEFPLPLGTSTTPTTDNMGKWESLSALDGVRHQHADHCFIRLEDEGD